MRILIDIGHPAHVHLFKNFAHLMIQKGSQVHFTVRDKEFEIALLEHEGFSYTNFGKHYKSKAGKIWGLVRFTINIVLVSIKFKPTIFLSHGSIYSALASFILHKPNISLEDTGNREQVRIYLPFSQAVVTSTSFPHNYGSKQIFYEGYHELAYLHPRYFTPDKNIIGELGVKDNERYFILRFVSWDATHDIGQGGVSYEMKKQLVDLLTRHGKLFISSETKLSAEFEAYRFHLPPEKMHHALAFADLFVGEGVTMASECAVLGTPAVYVNSLQRGYTTEQEKLYSLVYNFSNDKGVIEKVKELLESPELKTNCKISRDKMLSEKIDVTGYLVWFVETWPGSFKRSKEYYEETMKRFL